MVFGDTTRFLRISKVVYWKLHSSKHDIFCGRARTRIRALWRIDDGVEF
jgi:hypothetical protein